MYCRTAADVSLFLRCQDGPSVSLQIPVQKLSAQAHLFGEQWIEHCHDKLWWRFVSVAYTLFFLISHFFTDTITWPLCTFMSVSCICMFLCFYQGVYVHCRFHSNPVSAFWKLKCAVSLSSQTLWLYFKQTQLSIMHNRERVEGRGGQGMESTFQLLLNPVNIFHVVWYLLSVWTVIMPTALQWNEVSMLDNASPSVFLSPICCSVLTQTCCRLTQHYFCLLRYRVLRLTAIPV